MLVFRIPDCLADIRIRSKAPPNFGRRTAPRSNQPRHLGQHSLLTDNTEVVRRGGRGDFLGSSRHRHRAGRDGSDYNEWVQSLEDMIGTGASQLLEQVFGNMANMGAPPPLPMIAPRTGVDSRSPVDLLQNLISGLNGRAGAGSRHRHVHHFEGRPSTTNIEMQIVNEALSSPSPNPYTTSDRWSDESAIFSGGLQAAERISSIAKRVNAALLPDKQRRDKEQREKDEKEVAEREKEIREQMAREAADAVQKAAEEQATLNNNSNDAEMPPQTTSSQNANDIAIPHDTVQDAAATQTPVNTGAGNGERLSWRERIERRRQAQAAQTTEASVAMGSNEGIPALGDSDASQSGSTQVGERDDLSEVLNLAARLSAVDHVSPSAPLTTGAQQASQDVDEPMSQVEGTEAVDDSGAATIGAADQGMQGAQAAAETSDQSQRITIQVHGNTVDITDTGIDPTFLEALPDDMREEVLNQHFRETRAAAAPPNQEVPTSINAEFLDALPPELRAEVLAQEAMEAARTRAAANPAASGTTTAAVPETAGQAGQAAGAEAAADIAEMDPVAFLASLDPHLRQTVLLEQGEEMLGALPPDMLEEYVAIAVLDYRHSLRGFFLRYRALRSREMRDHGFRRHLPRRTDLNQFRAVGASSGSRKTTPPVKRDAVQLLDKNGVAALVRLLFFPSPIKKNTLASILKHLCENSKTRIEIINLLLTVLYEGTRESGSGGETVDKTISTLTGAGHVGQMPASASKSSKVQSRGKAALPPSTPGVTASTPTSSYFAGLPHHLIASGPGDNIPQIAVQKSLETLAHLVGSNESSAAYFLSEQELPISLGRTDSKRPPLSGKRDKGKGRASEAPAPKEKVYPIIVLFSLMDRKTLTDSPVVMEALTKLLASITVPLRHLDLTASAENQGAAATGGLAGSSGSSAATTLPAPQEPAGAVGATIPPTPNTSVNEVPALTKPPHLPPSYLKMVVHVLDLGDCSSKMFSAALMLIHHLWLLPDARATISSELIALAQKYGSQLLSELAELNASLANRTADTSSPDSEVEVLRRFSQASSSQTKLLRVLKTIEYAKQQQSRAIKRRRALAERRKEEVEAKKGDVPEEYEQILKQQEKAASSDGPPAMDTGDKEKAKAEAIQLNYQRQLEKVEAELAQLKTEEEVEQHKVEDLYNGFDFSPVWTKLSDCLTIMEQGSDVGSSAGTLLPLIEAFLMVSSW